MPHPNFALSKHVPPIPKGVEIDSPRTLQGGRAGCEGQWRYRNGHPVIYPDVKELLHYTDSSNRSSILDRGPLVGKDLAKIGHWKIKDDEDGRSEIFFANVMEDGRAKPNFINPKVTPRGIATEPYLQKYNRDKDLLVTIDVGEAEASNCQFFQIVSYAVVTEGSAPPSCIVRIHQWVRRKDFEG